MGEGVGRGAGGGAFQTDRCERDSQLVTDLHFRILSPVSTQNNHFHWGSLLFHSKPLYFLNYGSEFNFRTVTYCHCHTLKGYGSWQMAVTFDCQNDYGSYGSSDIRCWVLAVFNYGIMAVTERKL
jgi:hypothetical protein